MLKHSLILLSATAETQGNAKADQADIVSQNATLAKDLETAKASLATVTGERDAAKTELATVKTNLATVTGERDAAKTELATVKTNLATVTVERDTLKTENATLKAEKKTVDEAAAAKVSAIGIVSYKKDAAKSVDATAKKPTLTERVLAAQGCKTLAESEQKYRERLAANPGL